ncbi:MAG: Dabb family protein [Clostridiaceae bacterium]
MIKHVIVWTVKEEYKGAEKRAAMEKAKETLEALTDKIDGIVELKVYIDPLESSDSDLMLDSTFVSKSALDAYTIHPEHVAVATTFVRPIVSKRACFDCEI